ncbi:hypothetical protein AB0D49_14785 [Streptomyces sp. NPDC048290]|uniref:hypothetical protein n=1 Tax=Streptomyces sp. NPDC048290 TaxID=3155811 RepID=UPI0034280B2F
MTPRGDDSRDSRWSRPADGREPAAAALLSWLGDPRAPRLAVVTGTEDSGAERLLAWLIGHGTRPGTVGERRVHGFVPLPGLTATTAAWMLGEQLSIAARSPGELLAALAADPRRTVVALPGLHAAEDPAPLVRLALDLAASGHVRVLVEVRSGTRWARELSAGTCAFMDLDEARWTDETRRASWEATHGSEPAAGPSGPAPHPDGPATHPDGPAAQPDGPATGPGGPAPHPDGPATGPGGPAAGLEASAPQPPLPADPQPPQPPLPPPPFDLDDPASICVADPWAVTTAYERSDRPHGGLRAAWLRAGASLTREQPPAERALVLLTALGDDSDPRLPAALTSTARDASWTVVWHRVRGDVTPPWPGPARSLTAGTGALAGQLVVGDHQGTVRVLDAANARPAGRLPLPTPGALATAEHGDGTVTVLDEHGRLHTQVATDSTRPKGLAALLDDSPSTSERLLDAVHAHVRRQEATVTSLARAGGRVVLGDATGTVHVVGVDGDPRTAALHRGRVTAVAGVGLPVAAAGDALTLLYTGGADGTVRAWAPHTGPLPEPVAARACAVDAVAVTATGDAGPVLALAWADGLVERRALDDDRSHTFRPGSRVHALAFTTEGDLLVGTDESLIRLRHKDRENK